VGSFPFEEQDSTHLRRLSLVTTDHLRTLATAPSRYLYFMPSALGYQPRTTTANLLLIRLGVIVLSPYVTVTGLSGSPWPHAPYLHTTPVKDRRQSGWLGLPSRAVVVKPPFTRLPWLMTPSGQSG
jgi:hypothetical protein